MKDYKTLTYQGNKKGREQMAADISIHGRQGWRVVSVVSSDAGLDGKKTAAIGAGAACCIAPIFAFMGPLLGKRDPNIIVTLERDVPESIEQAQPAHHGLQCPGCGGPLPPNANFCTKCGRKVR